MRGWWIVLLATAAAVGAAAWLTARATPVFAAESLLAVTPSSEVEGAGEILDSIEALERRTVVATLARIPRAPETKDRAAERMGVEPRAVRYYWIGGSVVPNTNVVRVEVQGADPEVAARLADAVAAVTRREGRRLYRVYSLRELARAEVPARPVRPDARRNAAVAAVLGLFAGLLGAAVVELLRDPRRARRGA